MTERWPTPVASPRNLRIRMLTGKHPGFETTIPDMPYVVIHHADRPQLITVVLPGLTGDALILPDKPQEN